MYVSELIVTPFSLFNKRNAKIIWECIFGASRRVSFSYFPKIALDHRGAPQIPFRIFVDRVTISIQTLCRI